MTPSPVRSKGARTRDHVRARGPRAAPCRGRGAPAHRSAADVLDRRIGRPRLPGGEAPCSQRRALLTVRVADQVITVNLAPAALRKEGTGFDVAIALTVLAASGLVPPARLEEHACIGELGLDGRIRGVSGTIAAAEGAARAGAQGLAALDNGEDLVDELEKVFATTGDGPPKVLRLDNGPGDDFSSAATVLQW